MAASAPTPPTQEYCDARYGQPIGEVFTWRSFTFAKYVGDAACETHRQGEYLESNVVVNAHGDLVISAHRDGSSYSVGRVRLTDFGVPATDFEWGFEARLPDESAAPGARSALWLINLDQIYCDPRWGELDVMEWYSSRPDLPEAATHATCADATYASWHHKPATWDWGPAGRTGFHRWAVRKETHGPARPSHPQLPVRRPRLRHRHLRGPAARRDLLDRARTGAGPRSSRPRCSPTSRARSRGRRTTSRSRPRSWSSATCGSIRSSRECDE